MPEKFKSFSLIQHPVYEELMMTKLNIPKLHHKMIRRERLMAEFDRLIKPGTTLIHAPAGFGKTLSVAEWVQTRKVPTAWFTMDSFDNDPFCFWNYLLTSLGNISPKIKTCLMPLIEKNASPDLDSMVDHLVECFQDGGVPPLALVLDDLQTINEPVVLDNLFKLKDRLKNQHIYFIVIDRENNLEAERKIGAAVLRFDSNEIRELSQIHRVHLDPAQASMLEKKTDGWPVMVSMMMDHLRDYDESFEGHKAFDDHDLPLDAYLSTEIMQQLDSETRDFILKISILDRLTPESCNAVSGRLDSRRILDRLAKQYSFVVPLNQRKGWYKFKNILLSYLRFQLVKEKKHAVKPLYQAAALHYEENQLTDYAIHYYLKARNFEKAGLLVKERAPEMIRQEKRLEALNRWMNRFSKAYVKQHPDLLLVNGWVKFLLDQHDALIEIFRQTDHHADVDRDGNNEWILLQLNQALWKVNGETVSELMDHLILKEGFETVYPVIARKILRANDPHSLLDGIFGFYGNAALLEKENDKLYEKLTGLDPAIDPALLVLDAELHYEKNQLENSLLLLVRGMAEAEEASLWEGYMPAVFLFSRLMHSQGNPQAAATLIDKTIERFNELGIVEYGNKLCALKAWSDLEQGSLDAVEGWINECGIELHQKITAECSYDQLIYARALIAKNVYDQALVKLTQLEYFAIMNRRIHLGAEVLIWKSVVYYHTGNMEKSRESLEKALETGYQQGYQRTFIDAGADLYPVMNSMYRSGNFSCKKHEPVYDYGRSLLKEIKKWLSIHSKGNCNDQKNPRSELIEPMTFREKAILRCLAKEMTNQEIADFLNISVSTVKVHNRNIYGKLMVSNRTQAIAAAREKGLL